MEDPSRYTDLVQALAVLGYAVSQGERGECGYLVTSRTDSSDSSFARHLDDLADLAELLRWREQWTIRRQQGR